ncbi:condensation domain-containing protein, partial [Streptomyces sp. NPDC057336]|uniref:condensation domain-containing protein n=1 Tax=Streptomyces sp. NPDC057336 TaxID=3346102 RepID=UPI003639DCD3
VGGTGVARGYVGDPARTADKFVPDVYGPAGSRMYRTGDLARWRHDGAVEFLGRIDDQVKIRGYRIELGEVRAALITQPGITDAAVIVSEGHQRLIAYIVGETPDLTDALPEYMIPSHYIQLDAIPLTANGKLDRRALPDPDDTTTDTHIAPRTPTEERIAAIWSKVLGVERIGVEDNFFDLGGHSIKAIALVGALRAEGFEAAVRDVFQHRTVANLAATLTHGGDTTDTHQPVQPFALIADEDRDHLPDGLIDAYPVAKVQLGMLVEMLAGDGLHKYHNTATFRINDGRPFDAAALRHAARTVVERHEMLRTSFDLEGFSVPLQLVHPVAEPRVVVRDLRGTDAEGFTAARQEHIAAERAALFDLDRPPLLRFAALVESDEAWHLGFTHCHAITEGWSQQSLLREVLDLYQTYAAGEVPGEPEPVAVRYADFVAAEQQSLASDEDRSYWQGIVGEYAPCRLPQEWGAGNGAPREDFKLSVDFRDIEPELRELARSTDTSFKAVLLATHLRVLATVAGEDAFHTGVVYSARPETPGSERVFGMYLNTLPFAHDRTARTWRELVRQVFDREAEVYPHRRYPLPAVQQLAGGRRLFDVMYRYQDFHQTAGSAVDVQAGAGDSSNEFTLSVANVPGRLVLRAVSTGLDRANAERVAGMYRAVLDAMATDPDGDVHASLLSVTELAQVLDDFNDTEVEWG